MLFQMKRVTWMIKGDIDEGFMFGFAGYINIWRESVMFFNFKVDLWNSI